MMVMLLFFFIWIKIVAICKVQFIISPLLNGSTIFAYIYEKCMERTINDFFTVSNMFGIIVIFHQVHDSSEFFLVVIYVTM